MIDIFRSSLLECVNALEVTPQRIDWFGERAFDLSSDLVDDLPAAVLVDLLREALEALIYTHYYCSGAAQPLPRSVDALRHPQSSHDFVSSLSAANAGTGWLDHSWTLMKEAEDHLVIGGQKLLASISRAATSTTERGFAVLRSKEHLGVSPGYYLALGNVPLSPVTDGQTVRLYWNLRASHAAKFIHITTRELNRLSMPFQCKVSADPTNYSRCDSAVLYLERPDLDRARPALLAIIQDVSSGLLDTVPALTKKISRGVGIAEDPGDGTSFGMHRSRLIADGITKMIDNPSASTESRFASVCDVFQSSQISLDAPYLAAAKHGDDCFDELMAAVTDVNQPVGSGKIKRSSMLQGRECRSVASSIAKSLIDTAIWHNDQCTWIGAVGSESGAVAECSGPDIYSGTAGIGLFLAAYGSRAHDDRATRASVGALHFSANRLDDIPDDEQLSLYTGSLGVALACARVGRLCGDADIANLHGEIAQHALGLNPATDKADFLSGLAGGIMALLGLHQIDEDAGYLHHARELGDRLSASAIHSRRGSFWASDLTVGKMGLTGLSHGSAGIAYALLELDRWSPSEKLRSTAISAIQYEDSWFDQERKNWPDLRKSSHKISSRSPDVSKCLSYWCHGAPGIAISRLFATRISAEFRHSAIVALDNTRAAAVRLGAGENVDYSLCHGLCGLAEVLKIGSELLDGDDSQACLEAAVSIMQLGIDQYEHSSKPWPTGLGASSEVPGLMLGLAGIGYSYLSWENRLPSWIAPAPRT